MMSRSNQKISFVFATHNSYKVMEVMDLLNRSDLSISTLDDLGLLDEIIEDGATLEENAWIKANTIYKMTGGNVIAEDTGLEINALDKAPGVHTARYAGQDKNDQANIEKVLLELDIQNDRRASFRTILAVWYEERSFVFEGICPGRISKKPLGKEGFGYDPIFVPDGYNQSFGQLPAEIKNKISHRARAFDQFKVFLKSVR